MEVPRLERADRLKKALLQCAAYAHDFAGRLHLRGERVIGLREFVKGKARHLGDDVVECRLKGGRCIGQRNFVESHADPDFGGDAGDGVAARLGRQRRRAGDARIDLDQVVLEGAGIQRELDIAAALDLKGADHLQRAVAQHVILLIGERLRRTHDNRIPGVNAHGIQVFHVADGDGGVVSIAHHLILDLFVALDALLDQDLADRGEREGVLHDGKKFLLVVRKAAARPAERESGPKDDRISDVARRFKAFFHGTGDLRGQHRLSQPQAQLLEQLAVLRLLDGAAFGAQKLRPALRQDSLLLQLHGQIEPRLSANPRQNSVRPLFAHYFGNVFQSQRFHVDFVRDRRVGHDGRGVGIAQDDLVALLLERQAGLGPGIVKLGRLPDHDGTGADDENLVDISSLGHWIPPCFLPPASAQ